MRKLYLVLIMSASLLGCSSALDKDKQTMAVAPPINAEVERELVIAARSVERSLTSLARMQEAKDPPVLNTTPLITPEGGMGGSADIDWTGPLEPLIHRIAEMTDYRLKVLGNEPPIPIIISISQNKAVIADILKNASLQAGRRANIMVFPANRVIELRYEAMG